VLLPENLQLQQEDSRRHSIRHAASANCHTASAAASWQGAATHQQRQPGSHLAVLRSLCAAPAPAGNTTHKHAGVVAAHCKLLTCTAPAATPVCSQHAMLPSKHLPACRRNANCMHCICYLSIHACIGTGSHHACMCCCTCYCCICCTCCCCCCCCDAPCPGNLDHCSLAGSLMAAMP
jgi:hypothetical protein